MFPPQPTLATAPKLREPLWQRQDGEPDEDWAAFGAWVEYRDWHRVGALCGLTQQAALETATRWAWHARTRAWDAEHESHAATERKAHAAAVLVARQALPELLRKASDTATALFDLAYGEIIGHTAMAKAYRDGTTGETRPLYMTMADALRTARVAQQALRDLERMARPIGPESVGELDGSKDGQWDYSKQPDHVLRVIQLARNASKV